MCQHIKERKRTVRAKRKLPMLYSIDERKYMTDREILDKYIDLDSSCLTKEEKKEVMEMFYQYRETLSLKDDIGTCPHIEVEIDVTDKSPFSIRPYHVKEEDKTLIDKEMKRLCYLGILKEGFLPYSSPVMLISRKLMKDKRVVTDFRHLNVRIAKNNVAYPSLKDTFSMLGSFKCEVLSVLDLKDAFHSLRLSENSQKILWNTPFFCQCIVSISEDVYGIKHISLHMVIVYQCNYQLSSKQKILWSNHGWCKKITIN